MLKLSGISSGSLFRVCLSGFRADAAVTRRPVGAGCQRSPPSLHSCFCRLGHRAGHPTHHTHSLPVGTDWKTAHGTYRKFWNMCRVSSKSSFTYVSVHFQQGEHGLDEHKLHVFLSALQSLIPPLFAVVLQNAPFTSRVKLHGDIPAIEGRRDNIVTVLGGVLKVFLTQLFCFCSDPLSSASVPPPGCSNHHRKQRDVERAAAALRPPAGARRDHRMGEPTMGGQSIVRYVSTCVKRCSTAGVLYFNTPLFLSSAFLSS